MRIESLREPTVRGGRYTVTLDDGRKLRLEKSVIADFGLFSGRELEGEELLARAFCHEIDHLDGIVYVDKVEGDLLENTCEDDEEE